MKIVCFVALLLSPASVLFARQFPTTDTLPKLTYTIISCEKNTWGYDIYKNGRLFIHQPAIPAIPGNKGFTTIAAAEKTASKVMEKIRKGDNPPSVSIKEMQQMGVLPKSKI